MVEIQMTRSINYNYINIQIITMQLYKYINIQVYKFTNIQIYTI